MAELAAPTILTRPELEELLSENQGPVLSLYLPTQRVAVGPEENSLRLKNMLGDAAARLERRGLRRPQVDAYLQPFEELLGDNNFWVHQHEGLALFRSADAFRYYRLPYSVPETVHLGESVLIRHLLSALWPDARFFVLGLSQHLVKLLVCSPFGCEEVDLSEVDMPRTLEEALRYDDLQRGGFKQQIAPGPGRSAGGGGAAGARTGFHGHGEMGDEHKDQIRYFFQQVDKGLAQVLANEHAPLVIAGVDYLHPLFREVSHYRHIVEERIERSPDRLRNDELHSEALPIIERRRHSALAELAERHGDGQAHGLSSGDLEEVLIAALDGRVDSLFLLNDAEVWGRLNVDERSVELAPGRTDDGDDLLDLCARLVVRSGGTAYVVGEQEMPTNSAVGALYRYALAEVAAEGRGPS